MKMQIFIFAFLVLAISINVNKSYGQAVTGTKAPRPFNVGVTFNDPLAPVAGRPYDYSAIISPTGGNTYWYATKSTIFTTAGARVATEIPKDGVAILASATNYMTLAAAGTSPTTTQVTWTSAGLNGVTALVPLFMVIEYTGPTCTNTNIKVMQIIPKSAFTVDIANMFHGATPTALAYDATESQCYASVTSAAFNIVTKVIDIDYGVNVLYYEVIAANFTVSYKPTFKLTGLHGTQTADIDWGVTVGTYGTSAGAAIASSAMPYTSPQQTVTTAQANTSAGVSIYVRVTVKNNGYEGTTSDPITLAVEAVDGYANADLDADGTTISSFDDLAMQTLNARPSVTAGTPQVAQKP